MAPGPGRSRSVGEFIDADQVSARLDFLLVDGCASAWPPSLTSDHVSMGPAWPHGRQPPPLDLSDP